MKNLFTITVIFFFQCFPSFSELNGKQLICECKDNFFCGEIGYKKHKDFQGYKFENNEMIVSYFFKEKDKIYIKSYPNKTYETDSDFIYWNVDKVLSYKLNRKNLSMSSINSLIDLTLNYQCKLINNTKQYDLKLKKMKMEFQSQYNKSRKENKI